VGRGNRRNMVGMLLRGGDSMEFNLVPYVFNYWIAWTSSAKIIEDLVSEYQIDNDLANDIVFLISTIDLGRYIQHHEKSWHEYIQSTEEIRDRGLNVKLTENLEHMVQNGTYFPSFEYRGVKILDPFLDETGCDMIEPIKYYGFEVIVDAISRCTLPF
jgi:hypothetical protein